MLKFLKIISFCFIVVNSQNILLYPEILCDDLHWIASRILFSFFDSQAFLTVVDFNTGHPHSLNAISCEQAHYFRSIEVYDSIETLDVGPTISTSGLSSYSTAHGYFVRTNLIDFINYRSLEKIASTNPKSTVMINIVEGTLEDSKELLRIAYDEYQMLNVAVLSYIPKFENDRMVMVEVIACVYNPFHENSPETFCIDFHPFNLDENLIKFEKYRRKRVEDLQGYKLKVNIFEFDMKSIPVYDENGKISHYTYPDGELLNAIAKYMNFTPVYVENAEGEDYGYQDSNGNFTGSLGAVEYGKVDLIANARFIADYNTEKSLFLQPITMTKLYFTIKKRETTRIINFALIFKLDFTSRIFFIVTILLFPVSYYIINRIESRVYGQKKLLSAVETLMYVLALIHGISTKHSQLRASRIIVTMVLFFALITSSFLQGTILNDSKTIITIGKVSKIDQLYERDFKIAMQPVLTYVFQGQIESSVNILLSPEDAVEIMQDDPKLAYLLMDTLTGNYLDRFYDNETGENLFEVVPESAFEFYIAMMAPKSSPLTERFNEAISVCVQMGLYEHHTKKAIDDNERVWIHRIENGIIPRKKSQSLNLNDFRDVFKLYLMLNAVACVIFMLEFVTGH